MKVLLIKDVYKLGRAGDVKKVANGFGRNFLIPQGLAVLATPGALKQVDHIRAAAATQRAALNSEMSGVAEKLEGQTLTFPVKAGETGKLYGSITSQMLADAIKAALGFEIDRRNIETEPIRNLGEHEITVRLTMDLIPSMTVIVHREGESAEAEPEIVEEVTDEETEEVATEEVEEVDFSAEEEDEFEDFE
ncbi:MAG: 50S ribosomal protein L9 [Anaerolineaceae bacterium]|nr:50S ribosomal protein L9 [Anaerolineaceae bacterium]